MIELRLKGKPVKVSTYPMKTIKPWVALPVLKVPDMFEEVYSGIREEWQKVMGVLTAEDEALIARIRQKLKDWYG